MNVCPSCGQSMSSGESAPLTPAELDALSAWWHTGTVRKAAALLSRSERTIVNQLYSARIRNKVHTTLELVQLHLASLRSMPDLIESHNISRGKVA
jgi:DNA-binding CsgD family transcriptional regulator